MPARTSNWRISPGRFATCCEAALEPQMPLAVATPRDAVAGCGHLLNGTRAHRGERVRDPEPSCRPSDRKLALGMGDTRESARCERQRQWRWLTQKGGGGIDRGHIAQYSGTKPERLVGSCVPGECELVLRAPVDVVEHTGRQPFLGQSTKVVHIGGCREPSPVWVELKFAEPQHCPQRIKHGAYRFTPLRFADPTVT